MEVCEVDDVASRRGQLIFVARNNPLWLHGVRHRMEEPILDEPQRNLLSEAGMTPWIH
jgi:hypothetical protein